VVAFQMRKPAEIGTKAAFPGFIELELSKSAADRQSAGCTRSKCDGYQVQIHLKDAAVKVFNLLAEIEYRGKCATVVQASRTSPANAKNLVSSHRPDQRRRNRGRSFHEMSGLRGMVRSGILSALGRVQTQALVGGS
jgi:hypothetical protein